LIRRLCRLACGVLLAAWLCGCATAPPGTGDVSQGQGAVRGFTLSGRLAIRQSARSEVLRLDWTHAPDSERLALSSPLGLQVMLLEESPGHARLSLPDRAPLEADDDTELMQKLLGYTLPVQGLALWATGRVPPGAAVETDGVGEGYTVRFTHDGWSGSLQRWRLVGADRLPGLIVVARDDLQLRLVVDQWRVRRGE
jgi:outer membrane lipoprotein LolB